MTPLTKEQIEALARELCGHIEVDPDTIHDPVGPVRTWDVVATFIASMIERHDAARDEALAERIERRAQSLWDAPEQQVVLGVSPHRKASVYADLATEIRNGTFIEVQP